jgi:hypothetical protein
MLSRRLLLPCLLVAAAPALAGAPAPQDRIDDVQESRDLLARLRAVFAPGTIAEPARDGAAVPSKCATLLVQEYRIERERLPAAVAHEVDGWLRVAEATAVRETAHFRFSYATEGPDAVPAEDLAPPDGVPDFVQRVADWGETSWARLVDEAGFPAPRLAAGRVDVTFREMAAYGYTHLVDGVPAIVLHRSFADFPANEDPEGSAAGCAKVTIAHELKHASQFAASGWTEGGWLEADAVWAEDHVFDVPDDYLRFLAQGSPVSDPAGWMTVVSYGDCLVPRLLAERHGVGVLVDFFARRAAHRHEAVTASYDVVLRARGSSLADAAAALGLWSWLCGANAPGRPVGFEEADRYPTPPIASHLERTAEGRLRGLGTHHLLATAPGHAGRPRIGFAGERGAPFALWAVTLERDGRRTVQPVSTAPGPVTVEIPRDWGDLATLAILVTATQPGGEASYGVTLDEPGAVDAPSLAGGAGLRLLPNRPNPFRHATTLAFSLPSASPATLSVYDAAGRLVRRLASGATLAAGLHEAVWDGRDDDGSPVAPGLYAVRLEAGAATAARKTLLVR